MSKGRQSESGREEALPGSSRRDPSDSSRRDFLVKCCQGASAAFIPAGLRGLGFRAAYASNPLKSGSDFHLHPHYRAQLPSRRRCSRRKPAWTISSRKNITTRLPPSCRSGAQASGHLRRMCARWRKFSPRSFAGTSFRPVESRLVRSSPPVEIRQNKFAGEPTLPKDEFLRDLRSAMDSFSEVITAEFQVTKH